MIKRRKNITTPKRTLLLVCATEAEALYFSQMRKDCRYVNLTVLAAPNAKNLKAIIDFTAKERNHGKFDSAWALFGFDDVSTSVEEIREMDEYVQKKKVRLCWFNPSFEIWFIMHLGAPGSFVRDITPLRGKLQEALPGYELTPEYLLTKGLNMHIRLFPRHAQADLNARNYNTVAKAATGLEATTMPLLNEDITAICGSADMSHNQKVRR